jgi:hypothetical protein
MSAETLLALVDRCETEGPSYELDAEISSELGLWRLVDGVVHPRIWTTSVAVAEAAVPAGYYAMIVLPDDGTLYGYGIFLIGAPDGTPPVTTGKSGRTPSNAHLAAALRAQALLETH